MNLGQDTPALVASGNINPYRAVISSGNDNEGSQAGANAGGILGVSDGSNKEVASTLHAEVSDTSRLQPGAIKLVEAGAAVNATDRLKADADGKAVPIATTGTVNQESFGVAVEDATGDTYIFRMRYDLQTIRPALT